MYCPFELSAFDARQMCVTIPAIVRRGQSFVFIYFDTVITGVAVRVQHRCPALVLGMFLAACCIGRSCSSAQQARQVEAFRPYEREPKHHIRMASIALREACWRWHQTSSPNLSKHKQIWMLCIGLHRSMYWPHYIRIITADAERDTCDHAAVQLLQACMLFNASL
jgi:hypothetical protein